MAANKTRFTVMAHDEWTTDVPEHSDLRPPEYWDRRARGLGATRSRPSVSCGEENLLAMKGDPYSTENILIHEFAHAIHEMGLSTVDPTLILDWRMRIDPPSMRDCGRCLRLDQSDGVLGQRRFNAGSIPTGKMTTSTTMSIPASN
jgi:hypothetical protein